MFSVFMFFSLFAFIIVLECCIIFIVGSHQFCFIPGSPLSRCLECLTQTTNALNSKAFKIPNISNSKHSEVLKNNEIKTLGKILGSIKAWLWVCQSVGRQDHWGGQVGHRCARLWVDSNSPKFRPIVWKYYTISNHVIMAWKMKSVVKSLFWIF